MRQNSPPARAASEWAMVRTDERGAYQLHRAEPFAFSIVYIVQPDLNLAATGTGRDFVWT